MLNILVIIINLIAVVLIISFSLWYFLFKPLFEIESKFSFEIKEKILPDLQRTSDSMITLSSAAIFLTFSILKIKPGVISAEEILIASWFSFALCISFGIVIKIISYIYRTHYFVNLSLFENIKKNKKKNAKKLSEFTAIFDREKYFKKMLLIFLFLQPIAFLVSIFFIIFFAIINLT